MKKSKDITKYNLKWQMVRSSIKGPLVALNDKIATVNNYFDTERTVDAYERVLNYLEGLQMGYTGKDPRAVSQIGTEINRYRNMDTSSLLKEPSGFIKFEDASRYNFDDRLNLWKDLFLRNRKWLEKGYVQKEINDFMNVLNQLFQQNNEILPSAYSYEKLQQLRSNASTMKNTHKFFF